MTNIKQNKLLLIFIALFVITLLVRGVPALFGQYQEKRSDILQLDKKRFRYAQMIKDQAMIGANYKQRLEAEKILAKETYHGNSNELIAAQLQADINLLAQRTGINIQSMSLPSFEKNENMLLIIQSVSFKAFESSLSVFLENIYHHTPRLGLISIDLRQFGNQLSGTIKIIGFHLLEAEQIGDKP